ncbi:tripartite tricarboxylate transporter TctB family protein [Ramlibacter tataouinensis]|uniref:tripartite tricarboxylate transporter TctB family protein n=1 Tax=Ramlibacter tataouinensis TaxID=94132 RepID=UPI0022F3A674|nr:tripartite tricarboxylate transporter TctB family protein [Ramlibacter tataouinensis]WBY02973.1 tripartite tricarboxylate transporter TctB family protein [Ramlibacter tataouinensis]
MEQDRGAGAARGGVSMLAVEVVVAVLVFALGLTILIGSWTLGSSWTSDGPGPGYFPFYISLIMCVSGVGIAVQALRKRPEGIFADGQQLRQVLVVLVPAALYVLAVQLIGLYIASALYIALFMALLGKYSPVKSTVAAVAIMVLFFLLFEVWFKVPLFKGAFNLLQFTGY